MSPTSYLTALPRNTFPTQAIVERKALIAEVIGDCQEKDYFRMIFLCLQAVVAFTFLTGYDVPKS